MFAEFKRHLRDVFQGHLLRGDAALAAVDITRAISNAVLAVIGFASWSHALVSNGFALNQGGVSIRILGKTGFGGGFSCCEEPAEAPSIQGSLASEHSRRAELAV